MVLEIDGGYHTRRIDRDKERDKFFNDHGYEVVRIKNADTIEELAFLESLLYGIRQIKATDNRILLKPFMEELCQAINDYKQSMLDIDVDDYCDNYITDNFMPPLFTHKLMKRRLSGSESLVL